MYKILVLISGLLLSAALPVLAQTSNNSASSGQPEAKQQQSAPAKAEKKPDGRVQTRDSFTPSEKIRADTVVAFPADI